MQSVTVLWSEVIVICECNFQNIGVCLQLGNLMRAITWLRMFFKGVTRWWQSNRIYRVPPPRTKLEIKKRELDTQNKPKITPSKKRDLTKDRKNLLAHSIGRVRLLKASACSYRKQAEVMVLLWELPLERSACHVTTSSERPGGLSLLGREMRPIGDKATILSFSFLIFKGAKEQVLWFQPLNLSPGEGRAVQTGVTRRDSGAGGTGERCGWLAMGFYVLGYICNLQ